MEHERRARLTPAIADVRRAVRDGLDGLDGLVLVALSGGADSLALAAATAFEAPRAGIRAGAVIVDHGLQPGSADVAARAAARARGLGLDPVLVKRVTVAGHTPHDETGSGSGLANESGRSYSGPEAAARAARFAAFEYALAETGADRILLAHTLDDQAETVLLGLARGAGAASLHGMAAQTGPYLRPLLGIRRATTWQLCADSDLEPWQDPHNDDTAYARVRVRHSVLPVLERELGPGIAEALARSALQLREDAGALDTMVSELLEDLCEHSDAGIAISASALAANPAAIRNRIIRAVVLAEFGVALQRVHTLAAAALATDWHGQKALDLPGVRVERQDGRLIFSRA